MKDLVVDFDDFYDGVADRSLKFFSTLVKQVPDLKVTLFTIPMRTSPSVIEAVAKDCPWLQLVPHGWRHTRGECLGWTAEETAEKWSRCRDMGLVERVFKAPGWLASAEIYEAAASEDYILATHASYLVQEYEAKFPVREYVYNGELEQSRYRVLHGHLTDLGPAYKQPHELLTELSAEDSFKWLKDAVL